LLLAFRGGWWGLSTSDRDCALAWRLGCDVQRFICQGSVFGLFNLRV